MEEDDKVRLGYIALEVLRDNQLESPAAIGPIGLSSVKGFELRIQIWESLACRGY